MTRRILLFAVVFVAVHFTHGQMASADRLPLAKSKVCNKTTKKLYVATIIYDSYGVHVTKGWRYIPARKCADFKADGLYFRGKRTVVGLSKRGNKGCVTFAKVFRLSLGTRDKAACKAKRGRLVTFHNIVVKPKRTIMVTK